MQYETLPQNPSDNNRHRSYHGYYRFHQDLEEGKRIPYHLLRHLARGVSDPDWDNYLVMATGPEGVAITYDYD